ncbi:hypothetical protein DVB69_16005 [Sporosarcina sp. BI001-red]|uniref:hypothetical protein n=1 Tax=Sporosarcina sp. BI001-red TaxID=2282866 RepID=UPI000E2733AD|nr:hypothetical protein [Sporosarcina sp. BI001-red]REB05256.1 hypothetical protein DVB69_16005 [Sporosarcina sp. BI001-red]
MSSSEKTGQSSWIDKIAEIVIENVSQPNRTVSQSSIILDSQTINLLILYILMNKEIKVSQEELTPTEHSTDLEKEIDALIAENKQHFEALIKDAQNGF